MAMTQNGKGDKPRPFSNRRQFEDNWDQIQWSLTKPTQSQEEETTPLTEGDMITEVIQTPPDLREISDKKHLEDLLRE